MKVIFKFPLSLLFTLSIISSKGLAQNVQAGLKINVIDSSNNEKQGFWIESTPFGRGEVFNHQIGYYKNGRDGLWSFYDYKGNIQRTECYNHINIDTTIISVVTYENNEIKQIDLYSEYNIPGVDTLAIPNSNTGNMEFLYVCKRERQVLSNQKFKKF